MKSKQKNKKRGPKSKGARGPHKGAPSQQRAPKLPGPKGPKIHADLFGFHAVAEAWLNPDRDIKALYMTDNAMAGFEDTMRAAREQGLDRPGPTPVSKSALDKALPPGAVHQGLAIKGGALPPLGLPDLLIKVKNQGRALFVILDQVTDPHNVGAIARSACAFGADGLITQSRHAPDLTGTLAKAACGALDHVPVAEETNLARAIEELQENGFFVLGLDERGEMDIAKAASIHASGKCALVMGAEGPGMRRLLKDKSDMLVRLPMSGPMPSINVSNAAAIALYEFAKKNT